MGAKTDLLDLILSDKRAEVDIAKSKIPLSELKAQVRNLQETRGFESRIRSTIKSGKPAVIAECKKASPSKGLIRPDYNIAQIVASYKKSGAACLSVLTDEKYFQGSMEHLRLARKSCDLPLLRKDFMLEEYQIYESRVAGADCILLIVRALDESTLYELAEIAQETGMDVLIEVHSEEELEVALSIPFGIMGINNRNLRTFETTTSTTLNLAPLVPSDRIVVTESGIDSPREVERMVSSGIKAFLVGEAFMRAPNPGQKLVELFSGELLESWAVTV